MLSQTHPPAKFRTRLNKIKQRALTLFWWMTPREVLRALPGSSLEFGPPRRWSRWSRYRQRPGVEWREVIPESPAELPPPYFCNDRRTSFALPAGWRWPAAGVAVLPHGRILDEHGWVVGEDDTFLGDFCQLGNRRVSQVNHILKLRPPRRLAGRTLNLCSAHAITNFYHYVVDSVGRVGLVRRAGFTWDDFDRIVLPRYRTRTTMEIDAAIGIPMDRVIRVERKDQFVCDTLVQPSFPGQIAWTPPWLVNFYQGLFPPQSGACDRKLYIAREGKRRATNAAEIDARLAAAGFEKIDPMKTTNLRQLLAGASHVVGVHGAALANLLFCRPGTRILELMPSDVAGYHNRFYYHTLCASGRMPYGVVVGRSLHVRLLPILPQSHSDFRVDPGDLDRGLDALLER